MKKVVSFEIKQLQIMNADGSINGNLPEFAKDKNLLKALYRDMLLLRAFDAKAYAMQRTGMMGTYPASLGQEAIGVGYGSVMLKEDVLVPYYRSTGGMIQHGVTLKEIFQYWAGDERGSNYSIAKEDFPIAIPIATQCLHAAGVATAIKLKGEKRAVVTEIGEGGTSKGDFYETLNIAGIWNLPLVVIVNNNQWAISVPSQDQTACETYAQKAIAAGIEGLQVDGNDIIAMREISNYALEKARTGGGATMIEAISYRLCDHTTADDANRYRDKQEVEDNWHLEPIIRLKRYLQSIDALQESDDITIKESISKEIELALAEHRSVPEPRPESMFDSLYAELPSELLRQREEVKTRSEK